MESREVIEISSDSEQETIDVNTVKHKTVPAKKYRTTQVAQNRAIEIASEAVTPESGCFAKGIVSSGNKNLDRTQTNIPSIQGPDSIVIKPNSSRRQKSSSQQAELDNYAQELFDELNNSVFNNQMANTELVWNARLCTTAGRAFYHRDKQQNITTKIELSPKVVDRKERVRCTLAHEMCHLAVWVLDGDPTEKNHGTKFKKWAHLVEKNRPDITVSTTHSYEIHFRYKWECTRCGKIYGRHSNSINVEKSACGACTPCGTLKPLFPTRPRRKEMKESKFAPNSPQDSPRKLEAAPKYADIQPERADDPSSDQEVEILTQKLTDFSV